MKKSDAINLAASRGRVTGSAGSAVVSSRRAANLKKHILNKDAVIAVIGAGYVGLPLALAFSRKGYRVISFDTDLNKVAQLLQTKSYISTVPSAMIAKAIKMGKFSATYDAAKLKVADCIIICVPTPLTQEKIPDLSAVESASKAIVANLKTGSLVVLESTTYPGTTVEVVKPIIESTGQRCGKDFFLAFSPEREDPGVKGHALSNIPKVVGGCDRHSADLAQTLYAQVAQKVVPVSDTQTAEATKMLENIYRAVNIALVNELKMLFDRMGIDIWEVIAASSTKPFGYHPFYPGPGWGGHCIPIDPYYLSWKAKQHDFSTHFIELAGEINTKMAEYVVNKTIDALNRANKPLNKSTVLILGVAYKPNISDTRESPAIPIYKMLADGKADVIYHDPYAKTFDCKIAGTTIKARSRDWSPALLKNADCVLILTAHDFYDPRFIAKHARLIVETRNLMPRGIANVTRA
ncbi:MAG: nucleotide sugar dehydrogenase [Elusimicrobiota bacterium]